MALVTLAEVLAAVALLGLLFFTALADGALRSLNQVRLRSLLEQGMGRAEAMNRLLDHPHRITSTVLIVNTFTLAALAALVVLIAVRASPDGGAQRTIALGAIVLLGLVVIVFAQLVPRSLALRNPEATALRITGPLTGLYMLASPVAWAAQRLTNAVLGVFGVHTAPRNPFITEDDLSILVNAGEEEGVIEQEERDMIAGILRFGDAEAHEVMVPRPDVVAVDASLTPRQALDVALQSGHSRLPVYEESIDTVRGVAYLNDLVKAVLRAEERPLADVMREAVFIPETKRLAELLPELRATKVHLAVVVDEYGGTAGVVTIEDLLEEIVGEIQDESDMEQPDLEQTGPDEWVALARIDVDDLNQRLGLNLMSEDYDTLGGYLSARLDHLPEVGDEIEAEGYYMRVLDMEGRRTGRVRIRRAAPGEPREGAE